MKNYYQKYKRYIGKYVNFINQESPLSGKLVNISGNDFIFNPYAHKKLSIEDGKIFWKNFLIPEEIMVSINKPINIAFSNTSKKDLEEYCELTNIVEKEKSQKYEIGQIGFGKKESKQQITKPNS